MLPVGIDVLELKFYREHIFVKKLKPSIKY